MANHLQDILSRWYPARDQYRWVLASVIGIEGSNYRKTGAMMLINELGQYHGLISGGCLEKSLLNDVKKVLTFNRSLRVCFDSGDDAETNWAKALGCGGKVTILLQPVTAENLYHSLDVVYDALASHAHVHYAINIQANDVPELNNSSESNNRLLDAAEIEHFNLDSSHSSHSYRRYHQGREILVVVIKPKIQLVIFGGGADAIPLVQMATILGWQLTLIDNRGGYADPDVFPNIRIIRSANDSLEVKTLLDKINAAIIMTHNIAMDALALRALQMSSAEYIGLLGPTHRKQKVIKQAELLVENKALGSLASKPKIYEPVLYGPMGFDIGGDLPESVALSVLAQCHQVLEARSQISASDVPRRHLR